MRAPFFIVCMAIVGCGNGDVAGPGTDAGADDTGAPDGNGSIPSWSCERPYDGPTGGPRPDGPENPSVTSCADLDDGLILERYADWDAKVPTGSYFEPSGHLLRWAEPCSESPSESLEAAEEALPDGEVESEHTTDYFYEVVVCDDGRRYLHRNLRCDYFDGTTLAGAPHEDGSELGFLAGLLWFIDNHNTGGYQIIAVIPEVGTEGAAVELCTTRTVFGDFGLCDEVELHATRYEITTEGEVTLASEQLVKTLEGQCN
jgi:hypothetical protein